MSTLKVRVTAKVPKDLKKWFEDEAATSGVSMAARITMLMNEHRAKKEAEE